MTQGDHLWQPPPHPDWLAALNREGSYLDLPSVVPLDEESLLQHARRATGLDDFGDDLWREPFGVLLRSLEEEAQLMAEVDALVKDALPAPYQRVAVSSEPILSKDLIDWIVPSIDEEDENIDPRA